MQINQVAAAVQTGYLSCYGKYNVSSISTGYSPAVYAALFEHVWFASVLCCGAAVLCFTCFSTLYPRRLTHSVLCCGAAVLLLHVLQ
jgi:hypothetical protein